MIKLLIFVFIPILLFSFQRAPESIEARRVFTTQHSDKNTLYLEGIPLIAKNNNSDLLALIPVLTQNALTREIEMQIMFTYYPNMDKFLKTINITNLTNIRFKNAPITNIISKKVVDETLLIYEDFRIANFGSFKQDVLVPITGLKHSFEKNNTSQQIKTTGTLYIFPDNISNILEVLYQSGLNVAQTNSFINRKQNDLYYFKPKQYTLSDFSSLYNQFSRRTPILVANYPLNIISTNTNIDQKPTIIPLNNRFEITIKSSHGEQIFILSPYYLSLFERILHYYKTHS